MPVCLSCGKDVPVLCAEDDLCRDCSACCGGTAKVAEVRKLSPAPTRGS